MHTYMHFTGIKFFRPKGTHVSSRVKERITAIKVLVWTNRTKHTNANAFNTSTHMHTQIMAFTYYMYLQLY